MNDFNFKEVTSKQFSSNSKVELISLGTKDGVIVVCAAFKDEELIGTNTVFIPDAPKSPLTRMVDLIKTIYAHITDVRQK